MSATDGLIANNASYVAGFTKGSLPLPPAKKVAVLACMDARLDPARALGLEEGDAHVIRNARGVATEDALRSLVISQRLLEAPKRSSWSTTPIAGWRRFATMPSRTKSWPIRA
jgi:carbonic anhydrase